jgi:creatinine amidohydrolase
MSEIEWGRLNAAELNELARRDAVVIVPVASTEQHGPHLPTSVDVMLAGNVALRAARRAKDTPVIVTPVVWTGLAEHHMSLGGTVSLDYPEFFCVIRGICRSLTRQGFHRILLLNGHGGNIAALTVAVNELARELKAPIATACYWQLAEAAFGQILERQKNVRHACEAETSMMLALAPDLVDMSRAADVVGPTSREIAQVTGTSAVHRWQSFAARTSHGVIGDPRAASAEKGERLLDAAAKAVADLSGNTEFWALPS